MKLHSVRTPLSGPSGVRPGSGCRRAQSLVHLAGVTQLLAQLVHARILHLSDDSNAVCFLSALTRLHRKGYNLPLGSFFIFYFLFFAQSIPLLMCNGTERSGEKWKRFSLSLFLFYLFIFILIPL